MSDYNDAKERIEHFIDALKPALTELAQKDPGAKVTLVVGVFTKNHHIAAAGYRDASIFVEDVEAVLEGPDHDRDSKPDPDSAG